MKKWKTLILTDHSGHTEQNSVYAIARELSTDDRSLKVWIASRGDQRNVPFFEQNEFENLYAQEVSSAFNFEADSSQWATKGQCVKTHDFDIILLRLPRPITNDFLRSLSMYFSEKVIINNPAGIIHTSTKKFLLKVSEWCPPILWCSLFEEAKAFSERFEIVLKPLQEYGGKGIIRWGEKIHIKGTSYNQEQGQNLIKNTWPKDGYLAMKFLKNVTEGDKRILVVGGQIMAASLRLPQKENWLCNVAQGGRSIASEITPEERKIIEHIDPILQQQGILIYGVDTLCNDDGQRIISEINTLSVGGFPQAQKQQNRPIIQMTINKIFQYAGQSIR